MQSEREVAQDQTQPVQVNPENLAQEPAIPTRTDTTGSNEGAVNASMRVPTIEELSVNTPEQMRNNAQSATQDEEDIVQALEEVFGPIGKALESSPTYNEDISIRKLIDVTEGKMPLEDYLNEQRELMWKSFKESNRGTESFLVKDDPNSNDYTRRITTSDNGSLYRQLYSENGGRPTKEIFNMALDDVLENGRNSKYYDGFREFDHDGDRSVFGFNQGNENIDMILDLKDDLGVVVRTAKQQRLDAQMPKNEVKSIDQLVKGADTSTGNKFVTILRGVNNKLRDVVKNAIGVDISGYNHVVTESGINHALNKHGDNGSLSVTMEDIKKIPDIIKNADNIEYAGKNKQGLDVIRYAKAYDNRVIYMEEIRNGRHQLAMDTMYKQDIPAQQKSRLSGESSAINATDSVRALSRSGEIGNSNISQTAENVKNKSQFAENTSANPNFSDQTRRALKNNPVGYNPVTNEERLARANEILGTKSMDEVDTYLRDNFFNVNSSKKLK